MTYLKEAYYESYDKIIENEQNNPFILMKKATSLNQSKTHSLARELTY